MTNKPQFRILAIGWILLSFTSCGDAPSSGPGARPLDLSQESGQTQYALALAINEAIYAECQAKGAACAAGPIALQSGAAEQFSEILAEFSKRLRESLANPAAIPDLRIHPAVRIPIVLTESLTCPAGKFKTCAYSCNEVAGQFEPGEVPDDPVPGESVTICECKCFCTFVALPDAEAAACRAP